MTFTANDRRSTVLRIVLLAALSPLALHASAGDEPVAGHIETGRQLMEVLGQVNNLAPTPDAPLGSSVQFGYVSDLDGATDLFADPTPANQNETTARLTFFTTVTTVRVTPHGPFTVVVREGTTRFYRASAAASFASPDSFRAGEPVMSSTIRQQVIVDAVERTFTVVNVNTITSTRAFELGDQIARIGGRGDAFRTTLSGVLRVRDGAAPPTGHFAGSAVGWRHEHGE
jgi:hypothetical protein